MLDIDPADIDFLVTDSMVAEARRIVAEVLPGVDGTLERLCPEGIDRVYFVACGSPLCACQTAEMLLKRYSRIPSACYSGWDFLDQGPALLGPGTLVVAVSDSGNTEEVARAVTVARQAGAPTLAITRDPTGNLLATSAQETIAYRGECIWVLHLLCAYQVVFSAMRRVGDGKKIEEFESQLAAVPEVLSNLLREVYDQSKELGLIASSWPMIYTVAGGNLLPLAYKEGVITMLEFTWTHGSALNAAEFRHGPLEVVEEDVPYVFFLGTDESRHTTERCIRFVESISDRVIVFDAAELETGLNPVFDPLALFVPLEIFYLYLSLGKGHNPDDRRYYGGLVAY